MFPPHVYNNKENNNIMTMTDKVAQVRASYETFIHQSRYARWMESQGRRETWRETVSRYVTFMQGKYPTLLGQFGEPNDLWRELYDYILTKKVMPSMRAMMTAGEALDRNNLCAYNCSYIPIEDAQCFDELMYILLCGVGVGFSVERQYINNLPVIPTDLTKTETEIIVEDSKEGWASAYRELISLLYSGRIPRWDISKVRPAGSPLRTFGGRASGPEPLVSLFRHTVEVFKDSSGRRLNSIECHDLCCKIASIVVVGGVRRSALISLSNLTDQRMAGAKSGRWYDEDQQPYRAYANNSVAYTETPDVGAMLKEWTHIYESGAGERGIFSRPAAQMQASKWGRRDPDIEYGTNPCSEIILRPYQLCNLTEIVVRPEDTKKTLKEKARIAAILGTLQAGLTDFGYVRPKWKENCEEEALLGVSMTGICDMPLDFWAPKLLEEVRDVARTVNSDIAKRIGINPSAAITCVKPSGTVSQLCSTANGIHPQYDEYYVRRVRQDSKDPMTKFLLDQGMPGEDDVITNGHTVFEFPCHAPGITRDDLTAIEQLELWKLFSEHWCEHKPSITIYVRKHEWYEVLAWVTANWDIMSGIAVFPYSKPNYAQLPLEEYENMSDYEAAVLNFPTIRWEEFGEYESQDNTISSQELACVAGACEI
jgi:ribonucleoside-diphosphate reductase alpha chain